MITTIEIDTEDDYEVKKSIDILVGYLDKKKIPFICIGYTKHSNGSQSSIVTADGMRK
jgi:uncharacterized protein YajQ (UPF0234 family)